MQAQQAPTESRTWDVAVRDWIEMAGLKMTRTLEGGVRFGQPSPEFEKATGDVHRNKVAWLIDSDRPLLGLHLDRAGEPISSNLDKPEFQKRWGVTQKDADIVKGLSSKDGRRLSGEAIFDNNFVFLGLMDEWAKQDPSGKLVRDMSAAQIIAAVTDGAEKMRAEQKRFIPEDLQFDDSPVARPQADSAKSGAEPAQAKPVPAQVRRIYTEPGLDELSSLKPLDAILGKTKDQWVEGVDGLSAVSLFRNSPTNNSSLESLMGALVTASARAGKWVGIDTGWTKEQHDEFQQERAKEGAGLGRTERGLDAGLKAGFLELRTDDKDMFLLPTKLMAEFIEARMKPFQL